MYIILSLLLGACFTASGMLAKQINLYPGMGWEMSNPSLHGYVTRLGIWSHRPLPILFVVLGAAAHGLEGGCFTLGAMIIGGFLVGMLRPSYHLKLMLALIGVPVCVVAWIATAF